METPYYKAQHGISLIKDAVYTLLKDSYPEGLRNVDIGKSLGIYSGHKGHEGHISRTILEMMQSEGVIEQREDKLWYIVKNLPNEKKLN